MHRLALFVFLFSALVLGASSNAATSKPNIVVILCDDLGYGDLECYGHPHIKTPNLNKLAQGGIRFTDFYSAAPVCSPSRVGLLTGRSPNRAGVYDWIPPSDGKPRPNAREQVHMRTSETTIAQLLKDAGYDTCMSGKWHCNSRFNHNSQPQPGDFGFDHWFGTQNNAAPSHQNPRNYVRNGQPVGPMDGFSCQLAVDEVIQWFADREKANADNPFFVYLAFHEPHEPVASPQELVDVYSSVAKSEDEAQYFANVANVDKAVGRLVSALEGRGLRENTLIVFTSDNGPETLQRYRGAGRSWGRPTPLRGMKLHTHDAGFRVAGIMNWPAQIEPNQTNHSPVSSLDFLPTFCELAGTKPPSNRSLDGTSFLPALHGEQIHRTKPLAWCYFNALNEARMAMRDGKWKVLARLNGGEFPRLTNVTTENARDLANLPLTDFEIYDMTTDIAEAKNLAQDTNSSAPTPSLKAKLVEAYNDLISDSHVWPVASD